jgi:hypothetical protein
METHTQCPSAQRRCTTITFYTAFQIFDFTTETLTWQQGCDRDPYHPCRQLKPETIKRFRTLPYTSCVVHSGYIEAHPTLPRPTCALQPFTHRPDQLTALHFDVLVNTAPNFYFLTSWPTVNFSKRTVMGTSLLSLDFSFLGWGDTESTWYVGH